MSLDRNQAIEKGNQDLTRAVVITLLVMIICTLCLWYYHDVITWFPSHIHAWTQSDRLALAYGFLENGFDFFTPRTYNLYTSDGITGVDFPIHEYVVAILMKVLGTKEPVVFRFYTLAYSLVGYVFLFMLARKITRRDILAAVVVLFAFTAPILTYYQAGFIPSSTSLSSAFMGFYFFFRFREDLKHTHLYWAIGLLTLAVLPRASVNILLFAVLLLEVLRWWRAGKIDKKALLAFLIAYALIAASLVYKNYLSSEYGTRFLASLMPANDTTHLMDILRESWSRWHFQLLTKYHWLLLGISVIGAVMALVKGKYQRLDKEMLLLSLLLFGGSAVFFLALARQLIAHEYYFIDSLYPALILLLIPGLSVVGTSSRVGKLVWPFIFVGLVLAGAIDSKAIQNEKYSQTEWDRGEVTRKNFTGADTFLDDLGIPRNARMLVFEAYSTNAPLLLMGRRGYTILNTREENIQRALELDFDYIVVQDVYLPSELIYHSPGLAYTLQRIGGNRRISVYKYLSNMSPAVALPAQRRIPLLLKLLDKQYEQRIIMTSNMAQDRMYGSAEKDSILTVEKDNTLTEENDSTLTGIDPVIQNPSFVVVNATAERVTSKDEFGSSLNVSLKDLNGADHVLVDLSFDGLPSKPDVGFEFDIVLSIETKSGQKPFYKSYRVKRSRSTEVYNGYTCLFDIPEFEESDLNVKCYIWNRFQENLDVSAFRFTAYKSESGN